MFQIFFFASSMQMIFTDTVAALDNSDSGAMMEP